MKSHAKEIKGVYHLNLLPEHIAKDIFLVGDQARVSEISKHFDRIEYKIANREFVTHTGYIGHKRISAVSTGIGTDNVDIVLNELDALVNTHFDSAKEKEEKTSLNLVRLGTSGTIQSDIEVNSLVVSSHGLGIDNLMHFYANNKFDKDMQQAIDQQIKWPNELSKPYVYSADNELLNKFKGYQQGITVTAPGFYAPQGRKMRIPFAIEDLHQRLKSF